MNGIHVVTGFQFIIFNITAKYIRKCQTTLQVPGLKKDL